MSKEAGKKSLALLVLGALLFYYAPGAGAADTAEPAGQGSAVKEEAAGGFISPVERLLAAREAEAEKIEAFRKAREDRERSLKAAQAAREETARQRANGKAASLTEEEKNPSAGSSAAPQESR